MTRMIRKQLYITEAQQRRLQAAANADGVTEAELVRQSIDMRLADEGEHSRLQAIAYLKERFAEVAEIAKSTPQQERDWTRDDLYEDV